MKQALQILMILAAASAGFAQDDQHVIRQTASVAIMPVYQRWLLQGNEIFSQKSTSLTWYHPLGRDAGVMARGAFASSTGGVSSLTGLVDAQVMGNYYLEDANLVFGLGVNIPSGKRSLTPGEFATSFLISNSVFRLHVPNYGMGVNISPTIMWALPMGPSVVTGLGATYQYRGKYNPVAGLGDFDPGDEVSLATGIDVKMDAATTLTLNLIYTHFMKDRIDQIEVFTSGGKLLAALEFKRAFGLDELRLTGIYRHRAAGEQVIPGLQLSTQERTEPDQIELAGMVKIVASRLLTLHIGADIRVQELTPAAFSGSALASLSLGPEFTVSDHVSIPLRIRYASGYTNANRSLTGMEAGLGIILVYP